MIRIQANPRGELLVIGALEGSALADLLRFQSDTEIVLDLSQVREVDAAAIRMLARLPPSRCKLVNCPRWLARWLATERQSQPTGHLPP